MDELRRDQAHPSAPVLYVAHRTKLVVPTAVYSFAVPLHFNTSPLLRLEKSVCVRVCVCVRESIMPIRNRTAFSLNCIFSLFVGTVLPAARGFNHWAPTCSTSGTTVSSQCRAYGRTPGAIDTVVEARVNRMSYTRRQRASMLGSSSSGGSTSTTSTNRSVEEEWPFHKSR